MNWIDTVIPWKVLKQKNLFNYIRIILSVFILFKGVYFAINFNALTQYFTLVLSEFNLGIENVYLQDLILIQEISQDIFVIILIFMSTYVFISHILGGFLLALGLYTRWVCLILLPIFFIAIFLVNIPKGISSLSNIIEFSTSIIVFIGLVFFFINGAGVKSVDELRRKELNRIEGIA
jgi:uncharacterized membrane protein YphA (DoxX/SURF4 family)